MLGSCVAIWGSGARLLLAHGRDHHPAILPCLPSAAFAPQKAAACHGMRHAPPTRMDDPIRLPRFGAATAAASSGRLLSFNSLTGLSCHGHRHDGLYSPAAQPATLFTHVRNPLPQAPPSHRRWAAARALTRRHFAQPDIAHCCTPPDQAELSPATAEAPAVALSVALFNRRHRCTHTSNPGLQP